MFARLVIVVGVLSGLCGQRDRHAMIPQTTTDSRDEECPRLEKLSMHENFRTMPDAMCTCRAGTFQANRGHPHSLSPDVRSTTRRHPGS